MPGAAIRVEFDAAEVRRALGRLLAAGSDLALLMRDIGEALLDATRERFRDEKAPDGTPWAPVSETTKKRKTRNIDRILAESGVLGGNLAYRAGSGEVEIGSPDKRAGTHQFGAAKGAFGTTKRGAPIPWGDIPAHPFLGLSDADEADIRNIVLRHLADTLG